MHERIWTRLEEQSIDRRDPATWRPGCVGPQLRREETALTDNATIHAAMDTVFGGLGWVAKRNWGAVLANFPSRGKWLVPKGWHVPWDFDAAGHVTGVNLYVFATDVEEHSGGPCVVRSSPQLIERFLASNPDLESTKHFHATKQLFRSHPWLQELRGWPMRSNRNERLMAADTNIEDVGVRVVELTGKAGDVVICHPWLIQSIGANASTKPRFIRSCRVRCVSRR